MHVASSRNASNSMLITRNGHCQWEIYKKVSIFSCLVQVQYDLNVIGLLVISDCEVIVRFLK